MEQVLAQVLQWVFDYAMLNQGTTFMTVILAIFGVAAVIASFLSAPTESSSKLYKVFYTVINLMAINVGKAKNHDDVIAKKE